MALAISSSAVQHAISKDSVEGETVIRALMVKGHAPSEGANEPDTSTSAVDFVPPRFRPDVWLQSMEDNSRLARCCAVIARSSVGLGALSIPMRPAASQARGRRNLSKQVKRDVDALGAFVKCPNTVAVPFTEVVYQAELELQGCGNGFLEVVEEGRKAGAPVVGLLHVPAAFTRVHASGDKFVRQLRASRRKLFFRRLGDDDPAHRYIDKYTGRFYEEWPADLPESVKGTAIIHAKNYCPLDDFYGIPPWAPAVNAVAGNRQVGKWNLNFLQNNAHIPIAVIVEDGNLSEDSMEQITLFLSREGSGLKNAGRMLVLQPDLKSAAMGKGVKIRLQDLKVGVNDDASFLTYRKANDDEVQQVYGVAGIFLATGATTRATAVAEKQITYEQVVLPRATFWAYLLNTLIAPKIGTGTAEFAFVKPSNLDPMQAATVTQKLSQGLDINTLRRTAAGILQDADIEPVTDRGNTPLALLALTPPPTPGVAEGTSRSMQDLLLEVGRLAA